MTATTGRPPAEAAVARGNARIEGVDLARGLALLGMMAVHVFPTFAHGGQPTVATVVAGGRSAATFVLVAGVGLALASGGRRVVRGTDRRAFSAGLAVRAVLVAAIGLLLGPLDSVDVILPVYGVMFLLALPVLGLRPRVLVLLAGALVATGPVLLVVAARAGWDFDIQDLTPQLLVTRPVDLLAQLFVTGAYPIVGYLAYLLVGIAIGRLDLRSRRVAWSLLLGGVTLAAVARLVALLLLGPLGGLDRLIAQSGWHRSPARVGGLLLWSPSQEPSWWYLALASPHANTQLDLLHTLGSAMAVLGAALLLCRSAALRRWLRPVAAAGAMTLTLYTAHVVVLAAVDLPSAVLYVLLVAAALLFAVGWGRRHRRGPLEGLVASAAGRARRAVLERRPPGRPRIAAP